MCALSVLNICCMLLYNKHILLCEHICICIVPPTFTWFAAPVSHVISCCPVCMLCCIYASKPCMLYVHVLCTYVGILASDSSAQSSRVQVAIQTLDENDNAPHLAEPYDMFVCDSAAPGQVSSRRRWVVVPRPPAAVPLKGLSSSSQLIQVIRALDRDEVGNSSQVSLQGPVGPDANFTVRDNRGGWPPATTPMPVSFLSLPHPWPSLTAPAPPVEPSAQQKVGVHLQFFVCSYISLAWEAGRMDWTSPPGRYPNHLSFPTDGSASLLLPSRPAPPRQAPYLVPIELWDWGQPALSSTATVTISVCRCRPDGSMASCWPEAQLSPTGLSTGALLAIVTCMGTLLGESGHRGTRCGI